MRLGQNRPGEWFIFSDHAPKIPVPSWIVEKFPSEDEQTDLCQVLARIYGRGRVQGRDEGEEAIKQQFRALMTPRED